MAFALGNHDDRDGLGAWKFAVYQKLEIDGNRLTYRAYDIEGQVRDELIIEK